jgi:hypothetical protein
MRRPRTALNRKRSQWEGITGNLGSRIDQIPHLKGLYESLVASTRQSLDLERQINTLQGRLGEALERLDQVAAEGEKIRGRLTAALQAEYGFESPQLHDFGLKPRRLRGRRKKTPEAEAPAPPPENPA